MSDAAHIDPWRIVLRTITCFEDAHALCALFRASPTELLANGRPANDIVGGILVGDRAFEGRVIEHLCERFGGVDADWSSLGDDISLTEDEILRFRHACAGAGVELRDATEEQLAAMTQEREALLEEQAPA
ncbi:hypothetical protein [Pendulispora albinea]|uniref:Uncharacterized protein n=1 Tax=Pendulispora albinea TaxID=2741071 RepID=A0ABZ2M789_9BACT